MCIIINDYLYRVARPCDPYNKETLFLFLKKTCARAAHLGISSRRKRTRFASYWIIIITSYSSSDTRWRNANIILDDDNNNNNNNKSMFIQWDGLASSHIARLTTHLIIILSLSLIMC